MILEKNKDVLNSRKCLGIFISVLHRKQIAKYAQFSCGLNNEHWINRISTPGVDDSLKIHVTFPIIIGLMMLQFKLFFNHIFNFLKIV